MTQKVILQKKSLQIQLLNILNTTKKLTGNFLFLQKLAKFGYVSITKYKVISAKESANTNEERVNVLQKSGK